MIAYTVIYVFIIYSLANSCFKLVDSIPNAIGKYMGAGGGDDYQASDSTVEGWIAGGASMASGAGKSVGGLGRGLGGKAGRASPGGKSGGGSGTE